MGVWIAIWVGSTMICGRIGAWIAGGAAPRLLAVLLTAGFLKGLPHTTEILWALAAGWLAYAILLGLRSPAPENAEEPQLSRERVTVALHEVANPHVQLVPLAEHLGTTTEEVRTALTEMGVPIAGGVRMKGRGVSPGVRAVDLPPLSPDGSGRPAAVVTSDNNDNNSVTVEKREGMSIIRVPSERRRRRTLLARRR